MATEIRPELSEKNPYWIGKHRYYELMLDTGLTSDQLAALVKDPVKEILSDGITDYRYSIRYGELIALNTHMIQKLYQMVEELLQQKEG